MSFTPEQLSALKAPLDASHVSERSQAGRSLSYIEGWHALAEANRIFGYDGWDRLTEIHRLAEPELVGDKWRVRFMAKVTVNVRADNVTITRQGVGYGSGIAKDQGDAHESAIKEAETDATKRALMTFGWPFGLALYDKSQEHVTNGNGGTARTNGSGAAQAALPEPGLPKAKSRPVYDALIKEMRAHKTPEAMTQWALQNTPRIYSMHDDFQRFFRDEYKTRLDALKEGATEDEEGRPI